MISGSIVARETGTRVLTLDPPTIHVKETAATECGIIFGLRPTTQIQRRTATGAVVAAAASDLTVGRHVRVWANAVMESCPGQASAEVVEILQ